jgi:hypothetical protein
MRNVTNADDGINPTRFSLIKALGGNDNTGMCRCPAHHDDNASLHVTEKNGKIVFYCHAGCSQDAVIAKLRKLNLWHSRALIRTQIAPNADDEFEEHTSFRQAFSVLRRATEANAGPPTTYLNGRCIETIPACAMLLPKTNRRFPAMVVPVVDATGKLLGAQLTYLTKQADQKLNAKVSRENFGRIKGGYVSLFEARPDKPLIIAEGIETALSAAQITGYPAIAALSATNMPTIVVPPCSEIIIAADNDQPGRDAADKLAQRLNGRTVRIVTPDGGKGYDWNDALKENSIKSLKRQFDNAPVFKPADTEPGWQPRSLDQFERREILWLWDHFLPLGMLTCVYGDGEVGKSTVLLDIAARVTKGDYLPRFGDDHQVRAPKGSVLIFCKEDNPGLIIRPRLEAAGADLSRVHMVTNARASNQADFEPVSSLDNVVEKFERLLKNIGDVKLVIIDPMSDYAGAKDLYRDDQVRNLINPLGNLAAKLDIAIVYILHLNKKTEKSARHRALGSVALMNVPRSTILVTKDQSQPDRRFFIQEKKNLTKDARAVAFTMRTVRSHPRVSWESDWQDITANDALVDRGPTKQQQAVEMLQTILADGAKQQTEIKEIMEKSGIHEGTLKLAKAKLKLVSSKRGSSWWWSLT